MENLYKKHRNNVLNNIRKDLNGRDKLIAYIFPHYTFVVYQKGMRKGFDWCQRT